MLTKDLKLIYERASLCRALELKVYEEYQRDVKIPIYLSAGQEYISATISYFLEKNNIHDRQIFIQHRGHSIYLNFNGDIRKLILELMGSPNGCANGMGGSASIQSVEQNIYGHDGLMGSHGPIAVGACYANKKFTLCFAGDAAAEEDYFLAAIGWAATKKLPIWFVIEDNDLSILTEKIIRRSWKMADVAKSFGAHAIEIEDDPIKIWDNLEPNLFNNTCLFNIKTNRLFWHGGAGIDDPNLFDRHREFSEKFGNNINIENKKLVDSLWEECRKKL